MFRLLVLGMYMVKPCASFRQRGDVFNPKGGRDEANCRKEIRSILVQSLAEKNKQHNSTKLPTSGDERATVGFFSLGSRNVGRVPCWQGFSLAGGRPTTLRAEWGGGVCVPAKPRTTKIFRIGLDIDLRETYGSGTDNKACRV